MAYLKLPKPINKVVTLVANSVSQTSGKDIDKAKEAGITPFSPTEDCVAFKEARLVMKCKKLYKSLLTEESFIDKSIIPAWYKDGDFHYLYVAEIENIWEEQ